MKYIISESRLDKIMFKYLDSVFGSRKIVDIGGQDQGFNKIWVVNNVVVAEISDNIIWIDTQILSAFIATFSLTRDEALDKIKKYIKRKFYADFINNIDDEYMDFNQKHYDIWRRRQ